MTMFVSDNDGAACRRKLEEMSDTFLKRQPNDDRFADDVGQVDMQLLLYRE